MLLTQDGLDSLTSFTVSAAPEYDVDGTRLAGNDGVLLTCNQRHEAKARSRWQWPGHVAAPTLRDMVLVAEVHWRQDHEAGPSETAEAKR